MIDIIKKNDIFNKISQLTSKEYNFKDCLIPLAINNDEVTAKELVAFWKLWQHFGENEEILAQAFFDGKCPLRFPQDNTEIIQLIKKAAKFIMDSYPNIEMENNVPDEEEILINNNLSSLEKKFKPVPCDYTRELKLAQACNNYELAFYYYFLNKYVNGDYYKVSVKSISNWPEMTELHANPVPGSSNKCIEYKFRELRSICDTLIFIDNTSYSIGDIYGLLYSKHKTNLNLKSIALNL